MFSARRPSRSGALSGFRDFRAVASASSIRKQLPRPPAGNTDIGAVTVQDMPSRSRGRVQLRLGATARFVGAEEALENVRMAHAGFRRRIRTLDTGFPVFTRSGLQSHRHS